MSHPRANLTLLLTAAALVVTLAAPAAAIPDSGASCESGFAGPFPCENIDLDNITQTVEIGLGTVSDLWGWTDPDTGQEWALTTTGFGFAFVDVTTPGEPRIAARAPIQQVSSGEIWRDVKVYDDHAFVVSENGNFGMWVFDLTRLRDISGSVPDNGEFNFAPDLIWPGFSFAHNIAINEDTGWAYVVGSDLCDAGLLFVDIRDPLAPVDGGCFADDGYTHDVQCVLYHGDDADHQGSEICFASNEDSLTIVDVTDKAAPLMLSRTEYPTSAYTHQGWQTPDHNWHIFGDELDEQGGNVAATTTYILETRDLDAPGEVKAFTQTTPSIDHNIYIVGDLVYQANYTSGVQIFRWTEAGLQAGELERVAYLDMDAPSGAPEFASAWTVYPFFESGTLIASSFEAGLFIMTPTVAPVVDPAPTPSEPAPPAPAPPPVDDAPSPLPTTGGGLALLGAAVAVVGGIGRRRRRR